MDKKYSILVIGAGVTGLTTAYTLVRHGYHVTVVFKQIARSETSSDVVSQAAGAIWEIPVSYFPSDDMKKENTIKRWAMQSYHRFSELAKSPHPTGIHARDYCFVSRDKICDTPMVWRFMDAHRHLPGFRHSHKIPQERGINGPGLVDGFSFHGLTVDMDIYLKWLQETCQSLGVRFHQQAIRGLLTDQIDSLKARYHVDLVVNCSGLGARELVGDNDAYPATGAALIVQKPRDLPLPDFAIDYPTVWVDKELQARGHALIVPRGKDKLWIGTIMSCAQNPSELHVDHPVIQRMLNACIRVYPALQDIVADQRMVLKTGERPMRKGIPRVQRDLKCQSIIHNYCHSALGIILSWGCAEDVLDIVKNNHPMSSKL